MRKIDCNISKVIIEFCVNGEKKSDIYINPSFSGGCRKIYSAIAHDSELSRNTLETIRNEHNENVVIDYMQGKFDVAGELIDGIAEAIGPDQYAEIAEYLPVIGITDLMTLAITIINSYSEYYTNMLKKGLKTNG